MHEHIKICICIIIYIYIYEHQPNSNLRSRGPDLKPILESYLRAFKSALNVIWLLQPQQLCANNYIMNETMSAPSIWNTWDTPSVSICKAANSESVAAVSVYADAASAPAIFVQVNISIVNSSFTQPWPSLDEVGWRLRKASSCSLRKSADWDRTCLSIYIYIYMYLSI